MTLLVSWFWFRIKLGLVLEHVTRQLSEWSISDGHFSDWGGVATEVFRQLCYSNLTARDDWEWIGSLWFFDLLLVDEMSVGIMSTVERSQRSGAKVVKTGAMKWVATSLINLCHKRKKLPTSFFVPASESQKNAAAMKIKFSRGYVI